jgi:hypothetical protein
MSSAQLEIIAALADELEAIAGEMRTSRLTQYSARIERKARIISHIAKDQQCPNSSPSIQAPVPS